CAGRFVETTDVEQYLRQLVECLSIVWIRCQCTPVFHNRILVRPSSLPRPQHVAFNNVDLRQPRIDCARLLDCDECALFPFLIRIVCKKLLDVSSTECGERRRKCGVFFCRTLEPLDRTVHARFCSLVE